MFFFELLVDVWATLASDIGLNLILDLELFSDEVFDDKYKKLLCHFER